MSNTKRVLLGLATFWPPAYVFIFMGVILFSMFGMESGSHDGLPVSFAIIFPIHMLTILGMFALIGTYLVLAVKNKDLTDNLRIIWVILFVTFGMFAMPVYWWLYVWNGPEPREG